MSERICSIADCNARHEGHGWCRQHYDKWRRYGDPLGEPSPRPKPEPRTCTLDDCEEPYVARGWCRFHYEKWHRMGDPLAIAPPPSRRDPSERFWEKVDKSGECWIWLGSKNSKGYGTFMYEKPKRVGAHRFAYEDQVGPIPEGLTIDHLCWNPSCVRPSHLEPVTQAENNRRERERLRGRDD